MRRTDNDLERWLAAEATGRTDEADAALAGLFIRLPRLVPSAGFAERVMRAAAAMPPALARPVRWPLRVALAACLALVGLSAPLLPLMVAPLASRLSLSGFVDSVTAGLVALARWSVEAVAFWDALARLGGWVAETVSAPPLATALLAALAASAAALRLLAELIADERSWSHVR